MKQKRWLPYLIGILICLGVGILAGILSRGGIDEYQASVIQPSLAPPAFLFPIVWSVLYILMGISAARIWLTDQSAARRKGLILFVIQLVVNFCWSFIFFNWQAFELAFLWLLLLWGLVSWMIITFRMIDKTAARLQLPYLLWLTFAAYLSALVWLLNHEMYL